MSVGALDGTPHPNPSPEGEGFEKVEPKFVREAGAAGPERTYFESECTPRNRAGEGFIDRNTKAAISVLPEYEKC